MGIGMRGEDGVVGAERVGWRRREMMRRTREAEIAADLLGKPYQSSLKGHYESLGIKVPKRYSSLSAPDVQPIGSSEEE